MKTVFRIALVLFALHAGADMTVTAGRLKLSVQADDDSVHAGVLPAITRLRDTNRRLLEIRVDGRPLLVFHRDLEGKLSGVDVPEVAELTAEPAADRLTEMLRGSAGRVLHSAVVPAAYGNRKPEVLRLDLLADPRIGPSERWKTNEDGTLYVITDHTCKPLYYAVVHGPDRVVFDLNGRAVLYDLDLLGSVDQGPASGVFFSRLVMNGRGDIEAVAPFAPAGAVLAVRKVNGEVTYELSR